MVSLSFSGFKFYQESVIIFYAGLSETTLRLKYSVMNDYLLLEGTYFITVSIVFVKPFQHIPFWWTPYVDFVGFNFLLLFWFALM